MNLKQALTQLVRYAIVGVISNALGYLLYIGLTALGMGPKLAMTLLYGVGVVQTFVFNKRWTFGHNGGNREVFIRYCAAYVFGYVINLVVLIVLVDRAGYPHEIVQGTMILILAGLLFSLQKFWVFHSEALRAPPPQQ